MAWQRPCHPCLASSFVDEKHLQCAGRMGPISRGVIFRMPVPKTFEKDTTASTAIAPRRGGLPARKQKLVLDYIEQHLAEEIALPALARLVRLSPYHFARAFRTSFGVPPHRYHMARRMHRAEELLLSSRLPVTQIGVRIGFRETSSFTRAYRRHAGVTPSEFRRRKGN